MHRREGGFYWHMEVGTGRNIYKAYHWPGFDSGERYDERNVLRLMREKAFQIRGMEAPALEPSPGFDAALDEARASGDVLRWECRLEGPRTFAAPAPPPDRVVVP